MHIKNMEHWNLMSDSSEEQELAHLSRLAAVANLSPENRLAYDRAVDRYNVNRLAEEDFLQEAEARGLERSWVKGLVKGLEKGIENGCLSEKHDIARNLKELGASKSLIAQSTGLSEEEVERL